MRSLLCWLHVLLVDIYQIILQDQEIDQELELLVLASDGLWDVVPNEVISIINDHYYSFHHISVLFFLVLLELNNIVNEINNLNCIVTLFISEKDKNIYSGINSHWYCS